MRYTRNIEYTYPIEVGNNLNPGTSYNTPRLDSTLWRVYIITVAVLQMILCMLTQYAVYTHARTRTHTHTHIKTHTCTNTHTQTHTRATHTRATHINAHTHAHVHTFASCISIYLLLGVTLYWGLFCIRVYLCRVYLCGVYLCRVYTPCVGASQGVGRFRCT